MMGFGEEFCHERRAPHVHGGAFRIFVRHRVLCLSPQPVHFRFIADHLSDSQIAVDQRGPTAEAEDTHQLDSTDGG